MEVPGCQLPETEFFETLKDQRSLWLYVLRDAGLGVVRASTLEERLFYISFTNWQFVPAL